MSSNEDCEWSVTGASKERDNDLFVVTDGDDIDVEVGEDRPECLLKVEEERLM